MKNYKDYLEKITHHHWRFKTPKMSVPAEVFMSEPLHPAPETFAQMEDIGSNDHLFERTAAMPDVCTKPGRKNAAGTTIVSERYILPQVNDSDPNCGMRLVKTNLTEENISPEELDKLFQRLEETVPTKKIFATYVPFRIVVDICRRGTVALVEHLGIKTRNELENSQSHGNFFGKEVSRRAIFDAIPKWYLMMAQIRLGVIGAAGNHFLDLMKVTDEIDPETCKKFGLKKGQYLFMVHTGSGILGQYTMYSYTAKKREHLSQAIMVFLGRLTFRSHKKKLYKSMKQKIDRHMTSDDSLLMYDGDAPEGELYMTARNAASNFGTANRATIIHNVAQTCQEVLGRNVAMDLLYDLPHISINREEHMGTAVWVHRNNTSRAYGPSQMQHHPLFKDTGEPVFIPSSMSTEAFVGVGTDANDASFYSAPHGTGKGVVASEDDVPKDREQLMAKMNRKGVNLYGAKSGKTINQDSSQYKDVSEVIEGVEENGITRIIAKMEPVSVIMY